MNKVKLRNFAKFIAKVPKKAFNMNFWVSSCLFDEDPTTTITIKELKESEPYCGTYCCLAGWQVIRKGYGIKDNLDVVNRKGHVVSTSPSMFTRESLELTYDESIKLFFRISWPHKDGENVFANTPQGAAKRILHLIETGE